VLKAAEEATRLRYDCLEHRADFVFETVLSSEEKVNFIKAAHEAGYFKNILLFRTASGKLTKQYSEKLPVWAQALHDAAKEKA